MNPRKSKPYKKEEDESRLMRKLFVNKIRSLTESDIRSEFEKYGEIEEVAMIVDRRNPARLYAFVVYHSADDCLKASRNMHPVIRGQTCECMLAAIGKDFSGYDYFNKNGILTDTKQRDGDPKKAKDRKKRAHQKRKHKAHHNGFARNGRAHRDGKSLPTARPDSSIQSNLGCADSPDAECDPSLIAHYQHSNCSTDSVVSHTVPPVPFHPQPHSYSVGRTVYPRHPQQPMFAQTQSRTLHHHHHHHHHHHQHQFPPQQHSQQQLAFGRTPFLSTARSCHATFQRAGYVQSVHGAPAEQPLPAQYGSGGPQPAPLQHGVLQNVAASGHSAYPLLQQHPLSGYGPLTAGPMAGTPTPSGTPSGYPPRAGPFQQIPQRQQQQQFVPPQYQQQLPPQRTQSPPNDAAAVAQQGTAPQHHPLSLRPRSQSHQIPHYDRRGASMGDMRPRALPEVATMAQQQHSLHRHPQHPQPAENYPAGHRVYHQVEDEEVDPVVAAEPLCPSMAAQSQSYHAGMFKERPTAGSSGNSSSHSTSSSTAKQEVNERSIPSLTYSASAHPPGVAAPSTAKLCFSYSAGGRSSIHSSSSRTAATMTPEMMDIIEAPDLLPYDVDGNDDFIPTPPAAQSQCTPMLQALTVSAPPPRILTVEEAQRAPDKELEEGMVMLTGYGDDDDDDDDDEEDSDGEGDDGDDHEDSGDDAADRPRMERE